MLVLNRLVFFCFLALFTLGCGDQGGDNRRVGDTSDTGDHTLPDTGTDANADTDPDREPEDHEGVLEVTVTGLPEGAWPEMEVFGTSGLLDVGSSGRIILIPGSYQLRPAPYLDGLSTFEAENQGLEITAGETRTITVDYTLVLASLEVVISGLPEGVAADVELRSEGLETLTLTESTELTDLTPASYQVRPSVVQDGDHWYEAETKTIELASDDDETVIILYDIIPGALEARVTGLPAGHSPELTITGPDGFSTTAQPHAPVEGLQPGEYVVSGPRVEDAGVFYDAPSQTVDVASTTTSEVTLDYDEVAGALQLAATGLPSNQSPRLTITGPDGFSATARPGDHLNDLATGQYTISGADVSLTNRIYRAAPVTIDVLSATADATLAYALVPGRLQVEASGHPSHLSPVLTVTGPAGFSTTTSPGGLLQNLEPGNYTLSGAQLGSNGLLYRAEDEVAQVRSEQTTALSIAYAKVPGDLRVNIEGLPAGLIPGVIVTDPDGQTSPLSVSTTLRAQTPGTHTITAPDVIDGLVIYRAASTSINVRSDELASTTITYEALPGDLSIAATGLPDNANYTLTLQGPSYPSPTPFTNDAFLNDITPGTYTISFNTSTVSTPYYDATYLPSPGSLTIDVSSDATADATVDYASVPGTLHLTHTLPDTGSLTLALSDSTSGVTQQFTLSGSGTTSLTLDPGHFTFAIASNDLGTDEFGNPYYITNLDGFFDISSDDVLSHDIVAPVPTLVWETRDGATGSLREVVGRVIEDSEITFDPSISQLFLDSSITINKALEIIGPGADQLTIEPSADNRAFEINYYGDLTLRGLRFTGFHNDHPGAVIQAHGYLNTYDSLFVDNSSTDDGGAIYQNASPALVTNTRFLNNHSARSGGAIASSTQAYRLRIIKSEFTGNSALDDGGALFYQSDERIYVSASTFTQNTSLSGAGGALFLSEHASTYSQIRDSLFQANSADTLGGATYLGKDTLISNSTFADNTATDEGGAIYFDYPVVASDKTALYELEYSTFSHNTAPNGSALAAACTGSYYDHRVDYLANIFVGNDSLRRCTGGGSARFYSRDHNYDADDQPGALPNPLLPLADNGGPTHTMAIDPAFEEQLSFSALACPSLSFDTSDNTSDQRGVVRPVHYSCTIGAYQFGDFDSTISVPEYGFEPFDGHGLGTSYNYGTTITTDAGYTWTLNGVRSETTYEIDGEGLMLREDGSSIRTVIADDALVNLYIRYRKAHTSSTPRLIAVAINGTIIEESHFFGTDPYDDTLHTLIIEDLEFTGDITLEILNTSGASNTQIVVDNITWNDSL
ncbi:hypothetical protein [Lujinxingia vulgaris]|uniref:hypothetical protein n=1 Tax=Lujinxingia vulgaris TaxID=2600176 RepID=UPI001E5F00A3|nr:hypothetical protein [Lujinxingia vulgaris]